MVKKLFYKEKEEICNMSKAGISQKEIAEKFGISQSSVCRIATENNIYRLYSKRYYQKKRKGLI